MSEFTGKTRRVFRVRLVLEEIPQVQHVSEGWIPQPATKPETLYQIGDTWQSFDEALARYEKAKAGLLLP